MIPEKKQTILLAEDDMSLSYLLIENLEVKGFNVVHATTGIEAMQALKQQPFSLCILDVMMPGVDGFTVAAVIRAQYPLTPFIFLTARNQEQDKIKGFECGADDYITKPFSFKELYYRMLVSLRRANPTERPGPEVISLGVVVLYASERVLEIAGNRKKLSQREVSILLLLLQQSGVFVSRSEILKRIWGNDDYFTAKSMDVYITRLRKLLKDAPAIELENLYGTGFRIRHKASQ